MGQAKKESPDSEKPIQITSVTFCQAAGLTLAIKVFIWLEI